jgi:transcriptional regulator with GAF, ATPase, and Fis domain
MAMDKKIQIQNKLLQALVKGRNLQEVSEVLYSELKELFPLQRLGIATITEDGQYCISRLNISENDIHLRKGYKAPLVNSSLYDLIHQAKPRIINDLREYLEGSPKSTSTRLIVNEGMRSNLSIPLISNSKAVGVLFLASSTPNAYNEIHLEWVEYISQVLSITLEKALLLDNLEKSQKMLLEALAEKEGMADELAGKVEDKSIQLREELNRNRLLLEMSTLLTEGKGLEQIIEKAGSFLKNQMSFTKTAVFITHHFEKKILLKNTFPQQQNLGSLLLPITGSSLEASLTNKEPFYISQNNPETQSQDARLWDTLNMKGKLALPLLISGKSVGLMLFAGPEQLRLNSLDISFLKDVGIQITLALNASHAFEEIRHKDRTLVLQNQFLRNNARGEEPLKTLVGSSQLMIQVRKAIQKVADASSSVLIMGETGSGKELAARAIHQSSAQVDQLFVHVNCSVVAPHLLEDLLFGGKNMGSDREDTPRLLLAEKGTLYLDEIAYLPLEVQARLVYFISTGESGGETPFKANVRIIASSSRDLGELCRKGLFREDLFFRLNVFPIYMPPLRERKEDIIEIINYYLFQYGKDLGKLDLRLHKESLNWAQNYPWPGNIRELQNIVERSIIIAETSEIFFPESNQNIPATTAPVGMITLDTSLSWRDWEKKILLEYLNFTNGKIYGDQGAAKLLRLPPTTLQGKLKKLGLNRAETLHP